MRDCAVVDPERNRSRTLHSGLEVVDDERRRFLTVDVETCAFATNSIVIVVHKPGLRSACPHVTNWMAAKDVPEVMKWSP